MIALLLKEAKKDSDISGPIMAIGGAEDKTPHSKILKRFFELAGGKDCDITVVPWASELKEAGENYKKLFTDFGAKKIFLLKKKSREDFLDAIERSAAVFFVGGDQKKLLDAIEELDLVHEIKVYHKKGTLIGGTSAGASILGTHIPYWSDKEEKMIYYRGLDLVPNSIIDQHFTQRNRKKRLEEGTSRFQDSTGYGIDEDTAIIFYPDGKKDEIGNGNILTIKSKD